MNRWKASAIHLTLSVLVLAVIAAVLVWRWYPPGLFQMAHADKLLLIIAGVDVVMGPLLTLIVYKQGKKSLKFDLTVIALLQLAAMGYGLSTVWQSRPVYMVGVVDRFQLVFASDLEPADLARARNGYGHLPWLNVETVSAPTPGDAGKRREQLLRTAESGKDRHLLPEFYAPFPAGADELRSRSVSVDDFIRQLNPRDTESFARALRGTGRARDEIRVLPINSTRGDATMLVDARSALPLKPVAIDPWPVLARIRDLR